MKDRTPASSSTFTWPGVLLTGVLAVAVVAVGFPYLFPPDDPPAPVSDTPAATAPMPVISPPVASPPTVTRQAAPAVRQPSAPTPARFRCDGRRHCSQMTSCAEATYFLRHCPNTAMDGDRDGVPCENQWCTDPLAR